MKTIALLSTIAIASFSAAAADVVVNPGDINITNLNVQREGNELNVSFGIDASQLKLKSNQEVAIVPSISNDNNVLDMPAVTVAGRNRLYYHLRNDADAYEQGVNLFHNGKDASDINYNVTIPFQQWMSYSNLGLNYVVSGCASCKEAEIDVVPLASIDMQPVEFVADYIYTRPVAQGVKIRKESGTAFIDFPVNVMKINPDFRNNAAELAKISNTIDRVKNDKDYTITSIDIKGYASPEGPYTTNERLAKGRTEALVTYVKNLYKFPKTVKFNTSYEAEDWNGLRAWVEKSDLAKKNEIIALIDSDLTPDQKDAKIKSEFPVDYPFLLQNVYPSLRHTDYTIQYTVREFTDVQEIVNILQAAPQKLGLNEFYLAAQTFKPGSDQYNQVFETAVMMYPDDAVANLNAANAAMSKGNLSSAAKYLNKAGNVAEADYARGVYAALNKDYKTAISYFNKAKSLPQARQALEQAQKCLDRPDGKILITPAK